MGLFDRLLRGRRVRRLTIDGRRVEVVDGAGVAVYETHGRIIARIVDVSEGPGLERDVNHVVDGYPEIDARVLGELIVGLAERAEVRALPTGWPSASEYATPLIAAAPSRFRSHRAWQGVTRHVSIGFSTAVICQRWYPDLGRGAWLPQRTWAAPDPDVPNHVDLGAATTATEIGEAVLLLLEEPPIAG